MRYQSVDDIVFTDKNGKSYTLKDMREFSQSQLLATVNTKENDMIDEIANRDEYYGKDTEHLVYAIYDMNAVKLFESDYDMSKIKKLEIPVI